jgi:hypothetical protein
VTWLATNADLPIAEQSRARCCRHEPNEADHNHKGGISRAEQTRQIRRCRKLKVGDHIKIGDRIIRIAGMSTQNVEDLSDDLILEIPISILDPDERG